VAVGVMVVLAGGLLFKVHADSQAREAQMAADQIRKDQEFAKREQESQRKYQAMVDQKSRDLATAKSEEDRNRIRREMEDEREKERARRSRSKAPVAGPSNRSSSPPAVKRPREITDDPLDGLKL
jgi:hypothetical protein